MTNQTYREQVKQALSDNVAEIKDYLLEQEVDLTDIYDIEEVLSEYLLSEDTITGNASGSYTFNTDEAKDMVVSNLEYVLDTLSEQPECSYLLIEQQWEDLDVFIRTETANNLAYLFIKDNLLEEN